MTTTAREYQRLPGWGIRRGGFLQFTATSSRLWLGRDHLLLVDSNGYAETYKRFSYRDIRAITLTRTNRRAVWNCVMLGFAAGLGALALSLGGVGGAILASVAGLFVLLSLINVALGPTCVCHITTAVQTDELASLHRIPRTLRVLARLRPLLVAAQEQPAAGIEPAGADPAAHGAVMAEHSELSS
jgi:hypothetical protein